MKLDNWVLERVNSIYPEFNNEVSTVFRIARSVCAVTVMICNAPQTINFTHTLHGDKIHPIGYNTAYITENDTLYIQSVI